MSRERIDDLTIDGELFVVLRNGEEQYSIWPAGKPVPAGWAAVGTPAGKDDCLAFIEATWTDLRPQSLRGQ